ncbi:MAG: AMIN domain-containing protein, partial [Marinibacterium sp.]
MKRGVLAVCLWLAAAMASAQGLSGLARIDPAASGIEAGAKGRSTLTIALSQGVPFRLFTLDAPRRLVIDFREADWAGIPVRELFAGEAVDTAKAGVYRPGLSRLVLALNRPLAVETAGLAVDPA